LSVVGTPVLRHAGLTISVSRFYLLIGKAVKRALDAAKYGGTVGNDFAGTVEELGPDVPEGVRKVGERVAGFISGSQLLFFPSMSLVVPVEQKLV
jgi:hypothetical protein